MGFSNHSIFILQDGSLKAVGYNNIGQLALGNTNAVYSPATPSLTGVKQVACGRAHTVFLMQDGSLKGVGMNAYGNLGLNNVNNQTTLQNNTVITGGVKQIDCGDDHTLFLMNDGTVKSVGMNDNGQCGQGNTTNPFSTVTTIPGLTGVKQIACGRFLSMFLMNDGTVMACGQNQVGQLGLGNSTSPITTPTAIPSLTGVKQIACGENFVMFLMSDGSVKATGSNGNGQFGNGGTTSSTSPISIGITGVKQIACGEYHTVFLMNDGTAKTVGYNNYGQCGNGGTTSISTPYSAMTNVKQVSCGLNYTALLLNDGTVRTVGDNNYGQLGNGSSAASVTAWQTPSISTVKNLWNVALGALLKFLVQSGSKYYTYSSDWVEVVGEPTETTFKTSGLDTLANIPASAFLLLSSPLIALYTDDSTAPPITIEGHKNLLGNDISTAEILMWTDGEESATVEVSGDKNLLLTEPAPVSILGWTDDTNASAMQVKLTGVPKPVLVLPKGDLRLNGVQNIDRFTLTATKSGGGKVMVAVSVDQGTTWKTWSGGVWFDITTDQIATSGMTPEVLNAIPSADWNTLRGTSDTIRFAYSLSLSDTTDTAYTDKLETQLDMSGHWVIAGDSMYRAEFMSPALLRVSIYSNGSYKVNY